MWATILPLIVKYGIPVAYEIWGVVSKHPEPTETAWAELLALNAKTDATYFAEAQARAATKPTV